VFVQREHLRDAIILMLDELDGQTTLTRHIRPGARLAIDLLDEDISANQPRYTKLLAQRALNLLDTYPGETMSRLAKALDGAAAAEHTVIRLAMDAISAKIDNLGRDAVTALDALAAWAELPGNKSTTAKSRTDRLKRHTPAALENTIEQLKTYGNRVVWWPYTSAARTTEPKPLFDGVPGRKLTPSQRIARKLASTHQQGATLTALAKLDDPSVQEDVVQLISALEPELWPQATAVHEGLNHWYTRQPIKSDTVSALIQH